MPLQAGGIHDIIVASAWILMAFIRLSYQVFADVAWKIAEFLQSPQKPLHELDCSWLRLRTGLSISSSPLFGRHFLKQQDIGKMPGDHSEVRQQRRASASKPLDCAAGPCKQPKNTWERGRHLAHFALPIYASGCYGTVQLPALL